MGKKKFATILSESTLAELRAYARDARIDISTVVDEAITNHLKVVRVRPAFKEAVSEVLNRHAEVLACLAK